MITALTGAQQKVVDQVRELTKERLAPRATSYDDEAVNPIENWRDLWEQGFLAMSVPKEYGGMELDELTYLMVLEEVAKGCTNTSMTLHMHSFVQRIMSVIATPQQKARYYSEVVEGGKLFGSWASEAAISLTRNFFVETTVEPVNGGYLINGVKHFCTMAGAASYYLLWCALSGSEDMSTGLVVAMVPADSPGIRIIGDWNTLGMRGTVSPSVEFKDCFVAAAEFLGEPGEILKAGVVEFAGVGFAAIYLGAATAALEFTTEYCKTRRFRPDPLPIAHDPTIQRHIAEMSIQLEAARLVLHQSASQWDEADVPTRGLLAAKAKYLCNEAALLATTKAIQVVGGRSATKALPLERAFRDVRTSTLMPPNVDTMLVNIGKAQLGLMESLYNVPK